MWICHNIKETKAVSMKMVYRFNLLCNEIKVPRLTLLALLILMRVLFAHTKN